MKPERAQQMVLRWVRFYTRGVPAPLGQRREEEIAVDMHDHIEYERTRGAHDRHIAISILSRTVRGIAADLSWRRQVATIKGKILKPNYPILALGSLLGVAAIVFGESDDAPGLVMLGLLVVVGALAFGLTPAIRKKSLLVGFVVGAVALTAIGATVAGWLENNF